MAPIYLFSIYIDTFVIAFRLEPLTDPFMCNLGTVLSIIMLIDSILKFFLAFKANQTELVSEDQEKDEKDDLAAQEKYK